MEVTNGSKYLTPCRTFGLSRIKKRAKGSLGGQPSICGTPRPLNSPFRSPLLSASLSATNTTPKAQPLQKSCWSSPLTAKLQVKMGLSKPSSKNPRRSVASVQPSDLLKSVIAASVGNPSSNKRTTRCENEIDHRTVKRDIEKVSSGDLVGSDSPMIVSPNIEKKILKKSLTKSEEKHVVSTEGCSKLIKREKKDQGTVFPLVGGAEIENQCSQAEGRLLNDLEMEVVGCLGSHKEASDKLKTSELRGWDIENDEQCKDSLLKQNAFRQFLSRVKSVEAQISHPSVISDPSVGLKSEQDTRLGDVDVRCRDVVVVLEKCLSGPQRAYSNSDNYCARGKNEMSSSEGSETQLGRSRMRQKKYSRTKRKPILDSSDDEDSMSQEKIPSSSQHSDIEDVKGMPSLGILKADDQICISRKNPKIWPKKTLLVDSEEEHPSLQLDRNVSNVGLGGAANQDTPMRSWRRQASVLGQRKTNRKQLLSSDSDDNELVFQGANGRLKPRETGFQNTVSKVLPAPTMPVEVEANLSQNSSTATCREVYLSSDSEDEDWELSRSRKLQTTFTSSTVKKKDSENSFGRSKEGKLKKDAYSPRLPSDEEDSKDVTCLRDSESNCEREILSEAEDFERLKTEMRKWLQGGQRVIGEIIEEVRQQREKELTVMDVLKEHSINPVLVGYDQNLDQFVSFERFLTMNNLDP